MAKIGLFFDLDDTLFHSDAAYVQALVDVDIDPQGKPFLGARAAVKKQLGEGHVCARNRFLYFKELLISEKRYSPSALLDLTDRYEAALLKHVQNQWQVLGRANLFARFSGHPRVVVTNEIARTQTLKLKTIDPDGKLFPHVVTSEEAGVEKPNAALFELGFRRLGMSPKECVMIGDNLEFDILPALGFGCRAILTQEFKKATGNIPAGVPVLSSLNELPALLEELK